MERGFLDDIKERASRRNLDDMTLGPVLSWTTAAMVEQINACVQAHPGAKILFGGTPLQNHSIPERYGALEPTVIMSIFPSCGLPCTWH